MKAGQSSKQPNARESRDHDSVPVAPRHDGLLRGALSNNSHTAFVQIAKQLGRARIEVHVQEHAKGSENQIA
jgi:hypothetical protein